MHIEALHQVVPLILEGGVAVVDEMIYGALSQYFSLLKKTGYYKYADVQKLLVLIFYRDFVFNDYRGLISREDYLVIERALNCLFGTTCLIPYPDYLKMGKLHLGEITEIGQRLKNLEDTDVLKAVDVEEETDSDIRIFEEE